MKTNSYKNGVDNVGRKFGNLIAKFIVQKHLSVAEIERRSKVSRAAIYRHLKTEGVPTVITRQKYSEGLQYPNLDEFDAAWMREPPEASPELAKLLENASTDLVKPFASAEQFLASRGEPVPTPGERNAQMSTERQQPEDELEITLGVAACHWVPCDETGEFINGRPMHGRFSIIIAGDCMEPTWLDGERVTFEMLDKGETDFIVDEDYLVIRDGQATFKRCAKAGEDEIVLKAANERYRDTWTVLRSDIQRAAVAKYAHVNRRRKQPAPQPGIRSGPYTDSGGPIRLLDDTGHNGPHPTPPSGAKAKGQRRKPRRHSA